MLNGFTKCSGNSESVRVLLMAQFMTSDSSEMVVGKQDEWENRMKALKCPDEVCCGFVAATFLPREQLRKSKFDAVRHSPPNEFT